MILVHFLFILALSSASPHDSDRAYQRRRHPLASLMSNLENSWLAQLSNETDANRLKSRQIAGKADDGVSNNVMRPVFNGHYVSPVTTAPLANTRLVIYSPDVATSLGLSRFEVHSEEFLRFVSGDVDGSGINGTTAWATPYALSIMGRRYKNQCPYKTGVGYGDGRAVSIGEFLLPNNVWNETCTTDGAICSNAPHLAGDWWSPQLTCAPDRYELQLKGAGPTPFCRRADGRAVLRSSIREFLASEAMHYLGVPTTRALSLVVSDDVDGTGCTVRRPWYSNSYQMQGNQKGDPDVMITEPCAITCRASPSFVRVGHLDLYARRITRKEDGKYDTSTPEWKELEQMIWHAAYRDFKKECYDELHEKGDILEVVRRMTRFLSNEALSSMVANWIRVGFAQGNFNADNCLISGRTVDYGPFGFMDEYSPTFAKWTGSGYHFGFMNQAEAGLANYVVLLESLVPIIEAYDGPKEAKEHFEEMRSAASNTFPEKVKHVFRVKMGFNPDDDSADVADKLWIELEAILRDTRADWTLFWRQLYEIAKRYPVWSDPPSHDYPTMLNVLIGSDEKRQGSSPFYVLPDDGQRRMLHSWISNWRRTQIELYGSGCLGESPRFEKCVAPEEHMRRANPKYVLREWMLVEAYTKASPSSYKSSSMFPTDKEKVTKPDESMIHELYSLIQHPYDEGSEEQERKYYRRAPEESMQAGGTAYMS